MLANSMGSIGYKIDIYLLDSKDKILEINNLPEAL